MLMQRFKPMGRADLGRVIFFPRKHTGSNKSVFLSKDDGQQYTFSSATFVILYVGFHYCKHVLSFNLFFFFKLFYFSGAKMSYVNIGHGCPTGLRCRLDCIKDGWFFGTCHMVFCLCWPKLWTPE